MIRRGIFPGAAFAGAVVVAFAAVTVFGETVTLRLLDGERWWGGTVGGGWKMPLDASSRYAKDLRVDSDGNQCAPLRRLGASGAWTP